MRSKRNYARLLLWVLYPLFRVLGDYVRDYVLPPGHWSGVLFSGPAGRAEPGTDWLGRRDVG